MAGQALFVLTIIVNYAENFPMTARPRSIIAPLVLGAALTVTACGSNDPAGSSGEGPSVLAAFYPLAFVAEHVAGDHATVENLTQPGVESHDLELTGRQVGMVADSDLVLYLHGFQPSVDAAVEQNAADTAADVAELVELLPADAGEHADDDEHAQESDDHGDLAGDPHIWLDPTNMAALAESVAQELGDLDPDNRQAYESNAADLVGQLEALDQDFADGLAQCERSVFVVSHEAFGYLAHRYDLEQVGIAGLDPDSEPSPNRVAEVQDIVERKGITTIFYESLVSPTVAETLADDLGVETAVLDPIEGLSDDTADEDYLSLMTANLEALRTANGCA